MARVQDRSAEIEHKLEFDRPLDEVWTLLCDTGRMHVISSAGFSPYEAEDVVTADGTVERHARKKIGPFTLRWREKMGEWKVRNYLNQIRLFDTGPIRELTVKVVFSEEDGKTVVRGRFLARWSGLTGSALYRLGVLHWMTRQPVKAMKTTMAVYENLDLPVSRVQLQSTSARAESRLAAALERIEAGPYGHGLAHQLGDFLLRADPQSLRRIRPLVLARAWGVPQDQMIETCIAAHKAGVLSLRWVILCPRCRGGKSDRSNLGELPEGAHCSSCNIDFERDFLNNVELVFSPSEWLRSLPAGSYCMMSPAEVPHIKLQETVAPEATLETDLPLPPAQYRIRTVEAGGEILIDHDGRHWTGIVIDGDRISTDPAVSGTRLVVRNTGTAERSVVVENARFSRNRLTLGRLAAIPAFRDLCPEQLLRAGDTAGIGQVAILFSDLQGSTALYEEIGDATAYALVTRHFEFIEAIVRAEGGIIVKTVGDAVMAAFSEAAAALSAALEIQAQIRTFNTGHDQTAISLKLGLHEGPCVAMRAGQTLDFFGTTVNLAARLQSEARGGDIVVSPEIARQAVAAGQLRPGQIAWDRAALSGFSDTVAFARVRPH